MSWKRLEELENHADFIGGTEKLILTYIAYRCFDAEESGVRMSGGRTYGEREVFFTRTDLERFTGVSESAVRKAFKSLEKKGLYVRKWHTSSTGKRWTARSGECTTYVFPTVAEFEAARNKVMANRGRRSEWRDETPTIPAHTTRTRRRSDRAPRGHTHP